MTSPRLLPAVGVGLAVGVVLAALVGGGAAAWRAPAVGVAAGLLVVGLRRVLVLARREWRRDAPDRRAYVAAVLPLAVALLLAGLATA